MIRRSEKVGKAQNRGSSEMLVHIYHNTRRQSLPVVVRITRHIPIFISTLSHNASSQQFCSSNTGSRHPLPLRISPNSKFSLSLHVPSQSLFIYFFLSLILSSFHSTLLLAVQIFYRESRLLPSHR